VLSADNSKQPSIVLWPGCPELLGQIDQHRQGLPSWFRSGLGQGTDAFVTGQVAMMYSGPWALSTYEKYGKDLDFGIVPAPAGPMAIKVASWVVSVW